ncbi:hypothetical protein Aperf_G00000040430 [Anoplocephala perfoliata]
MSKRAAEKPLDYDHWDAPDEAPAQSAFEQADEATLKSRKLIHVSKKTQPITQSRRGIFRSLDAFGAVQTNPQSTPITSSPLQDTDFLSKLAALNKEVSQWISKHVDEDPYCILTPVFDDYAKHLASIESAKTVSKTEKSCVPTFPPFSATTTIAPVVLNSTAPQSTTVTSISSGSNGFNFSFKPSTSSDSSTTMKPPTFSFGLSAANASSSSTSSDSSTTMKPPTFSFGLSAANASSSSALSSNPPLFPLKSDLIKPAEKPTTTPGPLSTAPTSNTEEEDEEEFVPPKPEVKEIKEEGSVCTVRCKLFYKKDDQWVERGLGNLHIIPSGDEKFQLLVRANTNLGNILLNIMVNKDIPMQLQKNNVVFACVPSPPLMSAPKPKEGEDANSPPRPVPMLIRVKTPEMAEALLAEINKHRGKNSPS